MGLSENKVPQIRMVYYHVPVSKDYSWVTFSDTLICFNGGSVRSLTTRAKRPQ